MLEETAQGSVGNPRTMPVCGIVLWDSLLPAPLLLP